MSNLSVLSKTPERIISGQVIAYLTAADLLPLHQSAYRKGHSTETALLKVCADLIEAMDQGNHVLLGLLNLSAAFDTVDQDILIERLSRSYGIRSTALNWFCSYLIDRRQSVQRRCVDSKSSQVRSPPGLCAWSTAVRPLHGQFGEADG